MTATIVVHGGAGGGGEPQLEGVRVALEAGRSVLAHGGSALEAAVAAVVSLEADGQFDAGRGAYRTTAGTIELDAAVMDGATRRAGAVAAISNVRHPVEVARALLEGDGPLMLAGGGADAYALETGFELAPEDWFIAPTVDSPHGTVGAVALDAHGHVAAATSTGGVRGQVAGRVGDSPIIGAGTYADERVAISATGKGEAFMRAVFAYRVAASTDPLDAACAAALAEVQKLGGLGGCIAVTTDGTVALRHNTQVMPCGWATEGGECKVFLTCENGA